MFDFFSVQNCLRLFYLLTFAITQTLISSTDKKKNKSNFPFSCKSVIIGFVIITHLNRLGIEWIGAVLIEISNVTQISRLFNLFCYHRYRISVLFEFLPVLAIILIKFIDFAVVFLKSLFHEKFTVE